jgi:uncharacterized membrane protein
MFFKHLTTAILIISFFLLFTGTTFAQYKETRYEATITKILEEKDLTLQDKKQKFQKLELLITTGDLKGKKVNAEHGSIPVTYSPIYSMGDKVYILRANAPGDKDRFIITDYVRNTSLYILFAIFVAVVLLIGGLRGGLSLLGMVVSFSVIFFYILPSISSGKDPIFTAISASILIIPFTFYLSHGINGKTTSAVLGTVLSLIITGVLATFSVDFVHLSGTASEEAIFAKAAQDAINLRGLLLAGIIIGVLGILDDITISQAAIVYKLKETAPNISFSEIWKKSMDIGRDHIASTVNTLVLVYTGASMPLLILFIGSSLSIPDVLNHEMIAEEIVRTIVGSIGLILAVPITTFIASYLVEIKNPKLKFLK